MRMYVRHLQSKASISLCTINRKADPVKYEQIISSWIKFNSRALTEVSLIERICHV